MTGIALKDRNIYLHDVALDEALASWHSALSENNLMQPLGVETVPLDKAAGRVTAEPVWAKISSPHYHAAAMDGYAVRAEDTHGALETRPKALLIGSQAIVVDTGDPLPAGKNAVIMIEHTHLVQSPEGDAIEIMASTAPWRHVRAMGEDMVATELVLPANHRLRPQRSGRHRRLWPHRGQRLSTATHRHPAHRHRVGDAGQRAEAGFYHRIQLADVGGPG